MQSTSLGLYGHATYALNDKLSVIGGLRFSRETSELDSAAYGSDQTGAQGALRYEVKNLKESWNAVQPKLGINYQWSPGLLTYASYAVGATAGGYTPYTLGGQTLSIAAAARASATGAPAQPAPPPPRGHSAGDGGFSPAAAAPHLAPLRPWARAD